LGLLLSFGGCASTSNLPAPGDDSETVLVTYHVKPGKEAELQKVLSDAWDIYVTHQLVFPQPHVIVRGEEDGAKPRFVEVFTWISRSTPDHAPDAVAAEFSAMELLCESRGHATGIEIAEVKLLAPAR
jgi:hypothetical protein